MAWTKEKIVNAVLAGQPKWSKKALMEDIDRLVEDGWTLDAIALHFEGWMGSDEQLKQAGVLR